MPTIQAALRKTIADSFSIEELVLLCADTGIDPDSVPGRDRGKEFYVGEIINFAQRRNLHDAFIKKVMEERPHLQLSISLDTVSVSGWLYGEAHLAIDRKLFQEIRDFIGESIVYFRECDFEEPFLQDLMEPFRQFVGFCRKPESEFLKPSLERLRLLLLEAIFQFNYELVKETTSEGKMLGPSLRLRALDRRYNAEWIDRKEEIIERLSTMAESLWNIYYAFIQEGRRQLGVE